MGFSPPRFGTEPRKRWAEAHPTRVWCWIAWGALAALAGCSPASIGITGPGAQANRPEIKPLHNDAALPTVGVPNELNGYAPSAVPTTGPGGRYYGY